MSSESASSSASAPLPHRVAISCGTDDDDSLLDEPWLDEYKPHEFKQTFITPNIHYNHRNIKDTHELADFVESDTYYYPVDEDEEEEEEEEGQPEPESPGHVKMMHTIACGPDEDDDEQEREHESTQDTQAQAQAQAPAPALAQTSHRPSASHLHEKPPVTSSNSTSAQSQSDSASDLASALSRLLSSDVRHGLSEMGISWPNHTDGLAPASAPAPTQTSAETESSTETPTDTCLSSAARSMTRALANSNSNSNSNSNLPNAHAHAHAHDNNQCTDDDVEPSPSETPSPFTPLITAPHHSINDALAHFIASYPFTFRQSVTCIHGYHTHTCSCQDRTCTCQVTCQARDRTCESQLNQTTLTRLMYVFQSCADAHGLKIMHKHGHNPRHVSIMDPYASFSECAPPVYIPYLIIPFLDTYLHTDTFCTAAETSLAAYMCHHFLRHVVAHGDAHDTPATQHAMSYAQASIWALPLAQELGEHVNDALVTPNKTATSLPFGFYEITSVHIAESVIPIAMESPFDEPTTTTTAIPTTCTLPPHLCVSSLDVSAPVSESEVESECVRVRWPTDTTLLSTISRRCIGWQVTLGLTAGEDGMYQITQCGRWYPLHPHA